MLVMAKTFANQSFQPVSIDRATNLLLGDSESDARPLAPLFSHEQGKTVIGYSKIFRKNMTVIVGMREPG